MSIGKKSTEMVMTTRHHCTEVQGFASISEAYLRADP